MKAILILILFHASAHAVSITNFVKDKRKLSGTPSRSEVEFKMAFELPDGMYLKDIAKKIDIRLNKLVQEDPFHLSKMIGAKFSVDKNFKSYIFLDYYFDTDKLLLFWTGADYRLRYRWRHVDRYLGFIFLPFLKFFWPTRCEIQHKNSYSWDRRYNIVKVSESRFEFRNESAPFSLNNPAPQSPWDYDEFKEYLMSGFYKDYKLMPMDQLLGYIRAKGFKEDRVELLPRLKVVTTRYRTHLHIKNPWGSGPNPTQSFIITLDKSEFETMNLNDHRRVKKTYLEVEIEMERNITTEMELMMNLDIKKIQEELGETEFETAQEYSKKAYIKLQKDLILLRDELGQIIQARLGRKPMEPNHKYSRYIKEAVGKSK